MAERRVHVDRNATGSTGYCMEQLRRALNESVDGVTTTDQLADADVIHLSDLNVWAGVVHGKENRFDHFRKLFESVVRYPDRPLVVTEHGSIHFSDAREFAYGSGLNVGDAVSTFVRLTERVFATQVDAVLAISESVKCNLVTGGIDPERVYVTYNGVDDRYRDYLETDDERFVFHLSSYSPRKNPGAIFEVGRRLDARFVIAGDGWEENTPPELRDEANVEIRGRISEDELIELYNRAAVFYFPSLHEGFGVPLIEAMACGTAVVASDVYAVPEVVGDAAVCCDPSDVDCHVGEIRRFLEDDERRESYERMAVERARSFTWERTAQKVAQVYEHVLE